MHQRNGLNLRLTKKFYETNYRHEPHAVNCLHGDRSSARGHFEPSLVILESEPGNPRGIEIACAHAAESENDGEVEEEMSKKVS